MIHYRFNPPRTQFSPAAPRRQRGPPAPALLPVPRQGVQVRWRGWSRVDGGWCGYIKVFVHPKYFTIYQNMLTLFKQIISQLCKTLKNFCYALSLTLMAKQPSVTQKCVGLFFYINVLYSNENVSLPCEIFGEVLLF